MGRADLQARKAIQGPLESEVRQRDGGVEWIADGVGEPAVALQPRRQVRRALRMHEDQDAELLARGPERMKLRSGELGSCHAGPDGHAAHVERLDSMLKLLHGEVWKLQVDLAKTRFMTRTVRVHDQTVAATACRKRLDGWMLHPYCSSFHFP